jgi:hypothetical protein
MAGARIGRYLQYLAANKTTNTMITMAPNPCATRWNSWYYAVQYHAKNFELYRGFIECEMALCGKSAPQSVQTLSALLSCDDDRMKIAAHIEVIAEKCQSILHYLDKFEAQTPCTLKAFEWMEELQIYLNTNSQLATWISCPSFDDLKLDTRAKNVEIFQQAFDNAASNLLKYMSDSDGEKDGQPAIKFLKAVRIFDPRNVCILSRNQSDYEAIPGFSDLPQDEFGKYTEKYAPDAVASACGLWSSSGIDLF